MAEKFRMIVERAKNVPAKDVAEAMLKKAIPLMDPPPNKYQTKTADEWVSTKHRICKDLSVGMAYAIRDKYKASIWDREEFVNRTATITKFIDDEVPGCSCKDAKLLAFGSAQMFHPDFIVNCGSCHFHLSWGERKEYYQDKEDDPENYISTIGYGNRTPEQVIAILKENNIQTVFDVRRIGSKGRLRAYDHGKNFRTFLADHGIEYGQIQNPACCIGNQYDSLDEYKKNIKTGVMEWLAERIISYSSNTCFLCCELHAYKDDEPNCHRVHVADAVAKELRKQTGEPWGIEHL